MKEKLKTRLLISKTGCIKRFLRYGTLSVYAKCLYNLSMWEVGRDAVSGLMV